VPCSYFLFFAEVLLKVVHPLKVYHNTKFHGATLSGAIFVLPQNFELSCHFGMVADTSPKLWRRGHLQWHDLITEFHKNLPIRSEVQRGDKHTDRMVIYKPT
jgi:hypothetical protein